jgi:hypothetical protein
MDKEDSENSLTISEHFSEDSRKINKPFSNSNKV